MAQNLFLSVYWCVIGILFVYGMHRCVLIALYFLSPSRHDPQKRVCRDWPFVTIQLPIYNERQVIKRLVEAVCRIDYPRDSFEIQILDDSTDQSGELLEQIISDACEQRVAISHIHRANRTGFKAGALAEGLRIARGEFVAIFDADFVPHPSFLKKTIPCFNDPDVGMVQARWEHTNARQSLLTRLQSLLLDSHFAIDQKVRFNSYRFFNFNGSCGVWRRVAIESSGGWQGDTLAEDLDLSYRAQLSGWRFVFINESLARAELPPCMNDFKRQQRRWAKGTLQVALKLLPRVIKSREALTIKYEAIMHLTNYSAYFFTFLASLLVFPAMLMRINTLPKTPFFIDIAVFSVLIFSVFIYHILAQYAYHSRKCIYYVFYIPFLLALSIGLCVSNTYALFEAVIKKEHIFERTPKFGISGNEKKRISLRSWKPLFDRIAMFEVVCGMYYVCVCFFVLFMNAYTSIFFLIFFVFGFLYVGIFSCVPCARGSSCPSVTAS